MDKRMLAQGEKNTIDGKKWYMIQAIRATNQAIGRILRHKDDFGSVFLVDERFKEKEI